MNSVTPILVFFVGILSRMSHVIIAFMLFQAVSSMLVHFHSFVRRSDMRG